MSTILDAILDQYEKTQQSTSGTGSMSQDERMKKYFSALLGQDEKQGQRRLRILPTKDGSTFKQVWYHELQVDGKWLKIYDPGKNDNERSPLNEVHEELMSTGKETDKKLASQYKSRMFYIVKVIDRDNEQDGVKFWRFKSSYKNDGPFDKIIPIFRAKGDITDSEKGRDIIIELTKAKANNGKPYTAIQTIMYDDPSPVHEDPETAKLWLEDELTWSDVYSKKPVEYLEALANGETPKWDSVTGKYTYGDSSVGEESFGGQNSGGSINDPQVGEEPNDDLPF
jgi:hypothetical protein